MKMTKKYSVGDMICAKGKIIQVDESDGTFPYCVAFSDSNIPGIIDMSHAWIEEDSFVEPLAKPTLPKDVADEMEEYKLKGVDLINYFSSINISGCDTKNSYNYVYMNTHEVTKARISKLADAWNNGYTVEKPKLYNLILNDNYNGKVACLLKLTGLDRICASSETSDTDFKHNGKYQFTQEEINKCNEDFWIKNLDLNDYKVEVHTDDQRI